MKDRFTRLTTRSLASGVLLAVLGLITSEGVGALPAVRAAACRRLQGEVARRADLSLTASCGRVSLWRGTWPLESIAVEADEPSMTVNADRGLIRWSPRWSSPHIKVERVELDGVAVHADDDRWTLADLDLTLTDARGGGHRASALGTPVLCHRSDSATPPCVTLYGFDAHIERNGTEAYGTVHFQIEDSARVELDAWMSGSNVAVDARLHADNYARLVADVAPDVDALRVLDLDAPFGVGARLEGDRSDPSSLQLEIRVDDKALARHVRRFGTGMVLQGSFTFRPTVEPDAPELVIGPESPAFVALEALPEHVVKAVLFAEDAGFFHHPGFEETEILGALRANLDAGGVRRGASTITQQLAKNLWLSPDRTVERKIHEALGAVALEAMISKERILEIYLNSIEWGPGIYGLGPAAEHYFGVRPEALSPRQAAFLATIIPNPRRYHRYCREGALSDAWKRRVDDLLRLMHERSVIDDAQLEAALHEELVFVSEHPKSIAVAPASVSP